MSETKTKGSYRLEPAMESGWMVMLAFPNSFLRDVPLFAGPLEACLNFISDREEPAEPPAMTPGGEKYEWHIPAKVEPQADQAPDRIVGDNVGKETWADIANKPQTL